MSRTRTILSVIIIVLTPSDIRYFQCQRKTNKQKMIKYQTNFVYIYNKITSDNRSLIFMGDCQWAILFWGLFVPLGNFVFWAIMFLDNFDFWTILLLGVFVIWAFSFWGRFVCWAFWLSGFLFWSLLAFKPVGFRHFCYWAFWLWGLFVIGRSDL